MLLIGKFSKKCPSRSHSQNSNYFKPDAKLHQTITEYSWETNPLNLLFYFQNQQNMNKVSWWLLNTNCVSNKRKTADLSWPAADLALHSCLTFHVLVSSSHLLKYYLGYFQLRKHKFWSGIWHVTSYSELLVLKIIVSI